MITIQCCGQTMLTLYFVSDSDSDSDFGFIFQVEGIDHDVRTTSKGEYWRLLMSGKEYQIRASHEGQKTELSSIKIPDNPKKCVRHDISFK